MVNVRSERGSVTGDRRFMGPALDVKTESGDIRIASCYSDQSKFNTNTGETGFLIDQVRNLYDLFS